jgi:hypothetical protein
MKYMLLVYFLEKSFHERSESERSELLRDAVHLANQLHSNAQYFDAAPLHPCSETKCVRMRGGKKILTDGPFEETHEHLCAYFLINARDLNEAIEVATRIPGAQFGTIEVRQVMEVDGLPER